MNQQEKIYALGKKYEALGTFKGNEFIVSPAVGLQLLDELEALDVVIVGVTGWYYAELIDGSVGIAQDLSCDLAIPLEIVESEDAVKRSAEIAREFINNLSEDNKLISIDLYVPFTW